MSEMHCFNQSDIVKEVQSPSMDRIPNTVFFYMEDMQLLRNLQCNLIMCIVSIIPVLLSKKISHLIKLS